MARKVGKGTSASRNAKYEAQRRREGLTRVALWVPKSHAPDFLAMAQLCARDPDFRPFMVRSDRTGRLAKGV
jgi:hypothetical protein